MDSGNVYVVARLYDYEGYSAPLGVYTSRELADAAIYKDLTRWHDLKFGDYYKAPEVIEIQLNQEVFA